MVETAKQSRLNEIRAQARVMSRKTGITRLQRLTAMVTLLNEYQAVRAKPES